MAVRARALAPWLVALACVLGTLVWLEHRREAAMDARFAALERSVAAQWPPSPTFVPPIVWQAPSPDVPAAAPPSHRAESAPEPVAPTAAQAAEIARANEILDTSIRRGKLRREDVLAMREAFQRAEQPEAASETRRRISAAINRNELILEDERLLLP